MGLRNVVRIGAFLFVLLAMASAWGAPGPHGFPLPKDAKGAGAAPGAGGKIVIYEVPRARDAVAVELKDLLVKGGWKLDAEEKSPRGSVRFVVSKGGVTIKASLAGQGDRAALILTLP